MISPALALEAPADNAPPPPAVKEDRAAVPKIQIPQVKGLVAPKPAAAFLGVVTGELPKLLADHLVLDKGQGVVVRSVVSDSPAEKAGLAVNDVITKVGEISVGSPADITQQITSFKPGESVVLQIIHKGQPSKLEVKLESKPAELTMMDQLPPEQLDLENLPKELADRVRGAIAGNVGALDLQQDMDAETLSLEMKNAVEQMQKRMQGAFAEAMADEQESKEETRTTNSEATVRMSDNDGSVEVKSKNGAKQVTVRDHQDNVVWSGPWDTAADKQAAPGDVQTRVARLNLDSSFKGGGLRLRMNSHPVPPEE
ncbi:hypothetical protein GCM10023212_02540 [Luteolibacter yonseiensis]